YSYTGTSAATSSTSSTTTTSCYSTNDLANSLHYAFTIAVNYTGQWNATAVGYSGGGENDSSAAHPYFVDCFTGSGVGLIHFSDWNSGGQVTLQVVAQKTDAGDGNLSMTMTYGSSNSLTQTDSTTLPGGSAMVTGTMVGSTAVVSSPTTSTSTAAGTGTQLYDVTFQQLGDCSPAFYVAPWSVTLGSETIAQPSNATLPATG